VKDFAQYQAHVDGELARQAYVSGNFNLGMMTWVRPAFRARNKTGGSDHRRDHR
jgi:hypothetical protein